MRAHEMVELIISSVCFMDGFTWKEVMNCKSIEQDKCRSKIAITHLLSIYLSDEFAKEIMFCNQNRISDCNSRYRKYRGKYEELERTIYNKMEGKILAA